MRSEFIEGALLSVGILLLVASLPFEANAQETEEYALVKGTVFTFVGRSFPGVEIEIERVDVEEKDRKKTRREARSDSIGEFAFRLPPGPAKWKITFRAENFAEDKREIEIFADERVDLTVLLKPEGIAARGRTLMVRAHGSSEAETRREEELMLFHHDDE